MEKFERIALIAGIDKYKKPNTNLKGCWKDAFLMRDVLMYHENNIPNFDCSRTFTSKDTEVTTDFLLNEIEQFFLLESSMSLFYFSGHGFMNNHGGSLVTQDAEGYMQGIRMDDILHYAWTALEEKRVKDVVFIIDCCHSGDFGQAPFFKNAAFLPEGVSILAACRKYQSSYEINGVGRFTKLVANALKGGASDLCGEVKIPSIYAYVDDALKDPEQRPVFKSNVSKLVSIRNCHIDADRSVLRFLATFFKNGREKLSLGQFFKSGIHGNNQEGEKLVSYLIFFEDLDLIRAIDHENVLTAVKKSGRCVLTDLGRYYWELVNQKLLNKQI